MICSMANQPPQGITSASLGRQTRGIGAGRSFNLISREVIISVTGQFEKEGTWPAKGKRAIRMELYPPNPRTLTL